MWSLLGVCWIQFESSCFHAQAFHLWHFIHSSNTSSVLQWCLSAITFQYWGWSPRLWGGGLSCLCVLLSPLWLFPVGKAVPSRCWLFCVNCKNSKWGFRYYFFLLSCDKTLNLVEVVFLFSTLNCNTGTLLEFEILKQLYLLFCRTSSKLFYMHMEAILDLSDLSYSLLVTNAPDLLSIRIILKTSGLPITMSLKVWWHGAILLKPSDLH